MLLSHKLLTVLPCLFRIFLKEVPRFTSQASLVKDQALYEGNGRVVYQNFTAPRKGVFSTFLRPLSHAGNWGERTASRVVRQGRPVRSICWRKSSPRRGGGDIDFAAFYILPPCQTHTWGKMAARQNRVFSPLRGVASHAPCRTPRFRQSPSTKPTSLTAALTIAASTPFCDEGSR